MKVLLISHAFGPGRGSEPGFGWNWPWYLSNDHDIWVIAHPERQADVEAYLAERPNNRLHVVWLTATKWNPRAGQAGVQWHYLRWLKCAERVGKSLHADISFDLVHHVSLSTISAPPGWWKLGIPVIWGPLGGAQTCPAELRGLFDREESREWFRSLRLRLLQNYPPFRSAVRRSATVLAVNHETVRFLQAAGATTVPLFLDCGVVDETLPECPQMRDQPTTIRMLWASRFEKRKALPLALEAMALRRGTVPVKLLIAGGGPEGDRCKALAASLGLHDCVEFVGELDPPAMRREYQRSDIFLFTSIRDSFGSVVLEAMTHGLPVVTLNLHGVAAHMPESAGIKVAAQSRALTTRALADAIDTLAENPELRHEMGREGWRYAATQLWSARAAYMSALYRRVASSRGENYVCAQRVESREGA